MLFSIPLFKHCFRSINTNLTFLGTDLCAGQLKKNLIQLNYLEGFKKKSCETNNSTLFLSFVILPVMETLWLKKI